MNCNKCGFELSDSDKFCSKCGNSITNVVESADKLVIKPVGAQSEEIKRSKINFSKKQIIIISGIVILLSIGSVVYWAFFHSPYDGVSSAIYKEATAGASYYMSDNFMNDYYKNSSNDVDGYSDQIRSEIREKEKDLMSKCETEEEKTYVKASVAIMRNGLMMAQAESLKQTFSELGQEDSSEVVTATQDLIDTCDEIYQEYKDSKTIEDLEDIASSYL